VSSGEEIMINIQYPIEKEKRVAAFRYLLFNNSQIKPNIRNKMKIRYADDALFKKTCTELSEKNSGRFFFIASPIFSFPFS
jgi:hypothetical protein